jgi:muramidase (phage lysozyme)
LIKKDFILINPQGKQYGVPVPSPVTGYAGQVGQGWGAVNLYADKEMTKLIAQVGHMTNLQVKNGQLVQYGQTLGGQAGMGIKGANTYGTHVDMSTDPETYRRYIGDLQTGVFKGTGQNLFQQGVNAAKQTLTPAQKALPTSNAKQGNAVLWGQAANYSPSDLSNLTERGNKAMEALKNPNVRAFLDAIAIAEVGTKGASRGGYGYLIGDDVKGTESFDPNSLQSHPRKRIRYGPGKNEVSSATGRYQTMDFVWDEEAKRLGLKDFKPQSQEILAVSRLIYRGILPAIMAGDFKSVIKRSRKMDASSEWASLEGNPHGQGSPTGKLGLFLSNIEKNLQSQKTQSTPQQSSASSQSSVSQQPTNSQSPVSQQTANSNQQTPGPPTYTNKQDAMNLKKARVTLAEQKYNEIKERIEADNKESDNREKQNRELYDERRKLLNDKKLAEFAAKEALAPNDAAKKNIQKQAELYKINYSFEEKLINLNRKLEDRLGDRELKLKILEEAKKDKVTVLPSDAGVDYSKAINQLTAEIEETKKLRDLELATYDLNQSNADKEIEKNKARQREVEELSRAHEAYINQLRLEQSLADDGMKQNIQSKIDKAQIEHQAKITLMSLQNQLDDLQDDKVYLLGKGGLNADSDQVKKLQKDINELVATINSIKDNTSIDLKIFENQLKQVEEQNRRLKESVLINSEAQSLSGQAQLIRVEQGNEYKASALEAEAAKMQEQLRYKQELLQIEQQIAAVKGTANEYTEQEIAALKANAETINKINLKGISQQVRTLGRDLLDVSKNALGTFFSDIISGSKSAGDAFDNLVDNIIQQLIQLATNEFIKQIIPTIFGAVGSIFAGGAGAGAGAGGGEVLVAYQGGIIPNYANGGSVGAVADALHRERSMSGGKTPVLAALTPGEMVLTIEQTKRFQELRLDKVLNFANGGVVGGGQNLSNEIGSKNMTINIPVTVEGGGDSSVNVPRLQDSLRSVVLAEIQKQQRPGGALNK